MVLTTLEQAVLVRAAPIPLAPTTPEVAVERMVTTTEVMTTTLNGLVITPTNIQYPVDLIAGPIYESDKYNRCSIAIRYCGSLRTEAFTRISSSATP